MYFRGSMQGERLKNNKKFNKNTRTEKQNDWHLQL